MFGARALPRAAHAKSHVALKTKKSSKFGLEDRIFCRQTFFYHHILHEILHLLDTLDVFISLKLIVVDVFEMYAFSWKKTFFSKKFEIFEFWNFFWKKLNFQKNYQISNSSKNFAFWAMNKPKKLQRDFLQTIHS